MQHWAASKCPVHGMCAQDTHQWHREEVPGIGLSARRRVAVATCQGLALLSEAASVMLRVMLLRLRWRRVLVTSCQLLVVTLLAWPQNRENDLAEQALRAQTRMAL